MSRRQRRVDQDGAMKFYDKSKDFNTINHPVSAMGNKNSFIRNRLAPNMKIENDDELYSEIDLAKLPAAVQTIPVE